MPWAPDYVDLPETKRYLRVPAGDTVDDTWIGELITAASRAVDGRCNRQFGTADGLRVYEASEAVPDLTRAGWWLLVTDDIRADQLLPTPLRPGQLAAPGDTIGVAVGGQPVPAGGVQLLPRNAAADGTVYTGLRLATRPMGDVAVMGGWGWPSPPAQVRTATLLQVGRWHVRRESPYGTAGSPADGSETRLLAKLDPDVAVMLVRLSRTRGPR
jgi:hypothetical protein